MTQLVRTSAFHKDNISCVLQNKIGIHPAFFPFVISLRSSLGIPISMWPCGLKWTKCLWCLTSTCDGLCFTMITYLSKPSTHVCHRTHYTPNTYPLAHPFLFDQPIIKIVRWPVESCLSRAAQTWPNPNQISHEVAKWTSAEKKPFLPIDGIFFDINWK